MQCRADSIVRWTVTWIFACAGAATSRRRAVANLDPCGRYSDRQSRVLSWLPSQLESADAGPAESSSSSACGSSRSASRSSASSSSPSQRGPRHDLRPRRRPRRLHPPARDEQLWLSLGFSYMVVITGICLVAQADVVRYRALLLVLAVGKTASSLTSLAFFLFDERRLRLPAQLPRRRLARPARALALVADRPHRPPPRAGLKARAGALGRRAAHPERDLRGDGARNRRPAGGRA